MHIVVVHNSKPGHHDADGIGRVFEVQRMVTRGLPAFDGGRDHGHSGIEPEVTPNRATHL
ncbi:hypothetical protein KBZ10_07125 [Streptomyces sp. F63]|uniref:hypothetical protein n=1 Tax=Streptomyces sp. F63 TaxID=2824887 RepID=UPI001B366309|nr:hypothetical protein [Streptomyces sp. F63]MBQ0984296.1 hypothetical protein [Streptomyces sp. F63]